MSTSDEIGKYLRRARQNANMTQEAAGHIIGVDRQTIGNWEKGAALSMSLGKAIELADAYGCKTVDALVGR